MRHTPLLPAVLLAAGLALTGCADGDAQPQRASAASDATDSPSATTSASSSASASATPSGSPTAGAAPTEGSAPESSAPAAPTEAAEPSDPAQAPDQPRVVEPAPEETPVQAINPPYPTVPDAGAPATYPPNVGGVPPQNFTYDQAYAAWQNGMPYYDAFCLHYTPVTPAGVSQCEGIYYGTVDAVTGEYIGPR